MLLGGTKIQGKGERYGGECRVGEGWVDGLGGHGEKAGECAMKGKSRGADKVRGGERVRGHGLWEGGEGWREGALDGVCGVASSTEPKSL